MDGRKVAASCLLALALGTACEPAEVVEAFSVPPRETGPKPPVREIFRDSGRFRFRVAPSTPFEDGSAEGLAAGTGVERVQMVSVSDAETPSATISAMVIRFGPWGATELWGKTHRRGFGRLVIAGTDVAFERHASVPTGWVRYSDDVVVMLTGTPPATRGTLEDLARYLLEGA